MDPRAQELILRDVPPPIQRRHSIRARVPLYREIYTLSPFTFFVSPFQFISIYLSVKRKYTISIFSFFFLFSLFFSYVRCSTCKRGSDKRQSTRHEPLPAACHNRKRRIVPLDWLVNRIIMSSTTGQRDNDTIVAAPADHASSDFLLA